MRELQVNTLGTVHTLGKVHNLGGGAVFDVVESGTNPVQRILDSMPSELRAALVAWYWPKGQGITNEYLLDGYLSEEGTSILKDLSGNNHDMTIYGMTGEDGNGHIDEDGFLNFDGQDDYALCTNIEPSYDLTIISKDRFYGTTATWCNSPTLRAPSMAFVFCSQGWSGKVYWNSVATRPPSDRFPNGVHTTMFMPNNPNNSADEAIYKVDGVIYEMTKATLKLMKNSLSYGKVENATKRGDQYSMVMMSRHISEAEYNWLLSNMINI